MAGIEPLLHLRLLTEKPGQPWIASAVELTHFRRDLSRHMRRAVFFLIPLFINAIAGCTAGSGEGLDISGRPISEGGDVPLAPTLASVQANVFNPSCIVCHSGANAPQGLRLDAANSFTIWWRWIRWRGWIATIDKIIVKGNLGRDPEARYTPN